MNYENIYYQLVSSRKSLNRVFTTGCGYEKHHIIPKALGGSNHKDNLVILTPREHCLAHILLTKFYTGEAKGKMCYALIALSKLRNKNRSTITSREYDNLRKAHYKVINTPEYKALKSANTAKQWTPERRAAVAEKTKQQWATGVKREVFSSQQYKDKKRVQMLERWQDPDYQKQQSENAKQQWVKQKGLIQ
jgi:hypothetical protein